MPNNFRKTPSGTNGYYISKEGDDGTSVAYTGANLEAARNSPRLTLGSVTGYKVIGAGYYLGSVIKHDSNWLIHAGNPEVIQGDGNVVIDGEGLIRLVGGNFEPQIEGITFKNFLRFHGASNRGARKKKCTFIDIDEPSNSLPAYNVWQQECLFISSDRSNEYNIRKSGETAKDFNNTYFNYRTLVSRLGSGDNDFIEKCAFVRDDDDVCFEMTEDTSKLANISNCAFKGKLIIDGVTYSSFSDPALATAHADFVNNQGNFELTQSVNDCFNNPAQGDFSLKITSQLIKNGFTIGAKGLRFALYAGSAPELTFPDMVVDPANSTVGTDNVRLKGGVTDAQIISDPFLLDPINGSEVLIKMFDLIHQTSFDTDLATQQPDNQFVPVIAEFADGTAGANPRRLTFEIRTSSNPSTTAPTQDADWDNGFNGITAGDWIGHEFNDESFVLDNLSRSKSDVDFDPDLTQLVFAAVWAQVRVTQIDKLG